MVAFLPGALTCRGRAGDVHAGTGPRRAAGRDPIIASSPGRVVEPVAPSGAGVTRQTRDAEHRHGRPRHRAPTTDAPPAAPSTDTRRGHREPRPSSDAPPAVPARDTQSRGPPATPTTDTRPLRLPSPRRLPHPRHLPSEAGAGLVVLRRNPVPDWSFIVGKPPPFRRRMTNSREHHHQLAIRRRSKGEHSCAGAVTAHDAPPFALCQHHCLRTPLGSPQDCSRTPRGILPITAQSASPAPRELS